MVGDVVLRKALSVPLLLYIKGWMKVDDRNISVYCTSYACMYRWLLCVAT